MTPSYPITIPLTHTSMPVSEYLTLSPSLTLTPCACRPITRPSFERS
jgi:hypothetical protein